MYYMFALETYRLLVIKIKGEIKEAKQTIFRQKSVTKLHALLNNKKWKEKMARKKGENGENVICSFRFTP